jgi:hypothetical protein
VDLSCKEALDVFYDLVKATNSCLVSTPGHVRSEADVWKILDIGKRMVGSEGLA